MSLAIVGVIIIVGASAYYALEISGEEVEAKNPDTFIRDTIGEPETLDPAWAYDTASGEVIFNVYEPLIFYKGTSTDEFESRLATDWEISDDGLTYRFKIRDDVKFQNGNSLTPEDVEYSFERLMVFDRDGGPSWMLLEPLLDVKATRGENGMAVSFEDIDDAVEVDGDWVILHLAKPYPPLMSILGQTWSSIIDKEWASNNGCWPGTAATWEEYNNPEESPIDDVMNGTGPFELERWEKGVQVVLTRNDDYWRDAAELKYVKIKLVTEWSTRKSELKAGDADMVDVPRAHSEEVKGVEGIEVLEDLPSMQTNPAAFFTFDINPEGNDWIGSGKLDGDGVPPDFFSDVHVRKAFCYSLDYETYIEDAFLGQGIKVPGPIPSAVPYFNEDQETFSLDLDKAEEHFKQAFGGSIEDPGPVWENGFKITILYNEGNISRKIAAEIWEDKIEGLNDKFEIEIADVKWDTYLVEMVTAKLPVFVIGWLADFPDPHNFVVPFMDSQGTFSKWQSYSNPDADDLIDQGVATVDASEREDVYYDLQEIYHEDAPSIPLCEPTVNQYLRTWVEGYYYNPIFPGVYYYPISKD